MRLSKKLLLTVLPLISTFYSQICNAESKIAFPLHKACCSGDMVKIKELIENKSDVNSVDDKGESALHRASFRGSFLVVRQLLDAKADVNLLSKKGRISLHENFSYFYSDEVAGLLLEAKSDPEAAGIFGVRPLHLASYRRIEAGVDLLLVANANLEAADGEGGTPLHLASESGSIRIVKKLLAARANIHATTHIGETALHIAASEGYNDIVRLLLREFAKPQQLQEAHKNPQNLTINLPFVSLPAAASGNNPHLVNQRLSQFHLNT